MPAALSKILPFAWPVSFLSLSKLGSPIRTKSFSIRFFSAIVKSKHFCEALVYRSHGHYEDVIKLETFTLPPLGEEDIRIKMLAAPVNPADINMLEGTYAILPELPAIGGNEGVGKVLDVGSKVNNFTPGDWVIPVDSEFGTWRTEAVCHAASILKISKDIPLLSAATIGVNPCTAYRMLHDFEHLKPGDTVIQNGANSAVGQAVIQIAAAMGVKTINVVRDRPNLKELVEKLNCLGAHCIVTESMLLKRELVSIVKDLPKPRLALNCVGGQSAGYLLDYLQYGSTMVTYGGMAKKPVPVPAKAMIFKNIKIHGFWMSQWKRDNKHDISKQEAMLSELCELVKKGRLSAPACTEIPFYDYKIALDATMKPYQCSKQVLCML
ncbi:enoyl-[acyl-carrier-protein] reductase, mitochondrial-like [Protopterus annectens]|uniref:enoyl-[acyl-carrier-protein] reductase, mitochondrial-like n=1 Tax=Protopterus annectens TaxID=7888 RepID=UPI001CF9B2CD|nr:enoyl-[acyl-carrier-protein] reductase, mitochondrial-like [Protopterus annectens]